MAVSSCLLGLPVRYDGGDRRVDFLVEKLGPRVEWVRVCPEVEIGLGTPRDPIELHETDDPERPLLLQRGRDLTGLMRGWAETRITELRAQRIDAYVLKARSPSCGLREVKLVRLGGEVERAGTGIFAQALRESWPELPVFDETDLEDPEVARARVEWVFAMFHFHRRGPGPAGLLQFHRQHEAIVSSFPPEVVTELESLLEGPTPEEGAPEERAPEEGAPEEGASEEGAPEEGAPEERAPEERAPEERAAVATKRESLSERRTPEEGTAGGGDPESRAIAPADRYAQLLYEVLSRRPGPAP